ncbi:helix-turn-helix domain-containing protein [Kitasatospora cinereorecta]|uniref:helix-turn-helix domain-containing protein n=1 Tax=Kitasatospora cinereorecta TaxID=285560 RepID=UPI0036D41CA8
MRAIARATGEASVDENTLYRLRTGRSTNPSMKVMWSICQGLGITPGFLFPGVRWDVQEHRELTAALERDEVRRLCLRLAHMDSDRLAEVDRLLDAS